MCCWSRLLSFPLKLALSILIHTGQTLYCTDDKPCIPRPGGYSENYTSTLNSVEVYDPDTQTWSLAPPMPTPRGDLMCTTLNNALVVIGGYYDPSGAPRRTQISAFVMA